MAPPAGLDGTDLPAGRSRLVVVLAVVLLLAATGAVAVLGSSTGSDRTMSVAGSLLVAGRGTLVPGSSCSVSTMPGRTVTIFDDPGRAVATTVLPTTGTAVDQWQTATPWADACRFSFTAGQVPAGGDSYRVGLDGDPSHTVGFSREELTTTGARLTSGH